MICINDDLILRDRNELSIYAHELLKQADDDYSKKIIDLIIEFLYDVWGRAEKVEEMMAKYSTDKVFPMCYVDIHETADLTNVKIEAFSNDPDYSPKKIELMAFEQFCNKNFSSLRSLYDIFSSIDF